jgi:hypothetical protein
MTTHSARVSFLKFNRRHSVQLHLHRLYPQILPSHRYPSTVTFCASVLSSLHVPDRVKTLLSDIKISFRIYSSFKDAVSSSGKRDEVTGERRKLHNGELHNFYSSPDIIRQIKSRRMRWAGHVAHMGEGRKV